MSAYLSTLYRIGRKLDSWILVVAVVIAATVCLSTYATAERSHMTRPAVVMPASVTPTGGTALAPSFDPPPQGHAGLARLETLPIVIRRTGFEPSEVTLPQGRYVLGIDNQSGLQEVEVRMHHQRGQSRREVPLPRTHVRWREAMTLLPGEYLLSVAEQPEWTCRITVTTD